MTLENRHFEDGMIRKDHTLVSAEILKSKLDAAGLLDRHVTESFAVDPLLEGATEKSLEGTEKILELALKSIFPFL